MKNFPQLSYDHVLYHLPMAQGWALLNAAVESNPLIKVDRLSAGYIAQAISQQTKQEA